MTDPKKNNPAELPEDQLEEVSGGKTVIILRSMGYKRCAANPEHVYGEMLDACPTCGCREFTYV